MQQFVLRKSLSMVAVSQINVVIVKSETVSRFTLVYNVWEVFVSPQTI